MLLNDSNIERFFSKVDFTDTCWNWTTKFRYGQFKINGKMFSVHRLSYEYFYNSIPLGLQVCHHCDNTRCINPGHLFIGTQSDNMKDCVSKGRFNISFTKTPEYSRLMSIITSGENNGRCKLKENDVFKIIEQLSLGFNPTDICKEYNVNRSTIEAIRDKRSWAYLSGTHG